MATVLNVVRTVRDTYEFLTFRTDDEVNELCDKIKNEMVRLPNHSPVKEVLKERLQLLEMNQALAA